MSETEEDEKTKELVRRYLVQEINRAYNEFISIEFKRVLRGEGKGDPVGILDSKRGK